MSAMACFLAVVALATGSLPQGSKLLRGRCMSPDGRHVYLVHSIGRNWLPVTQVERGWCHNAALSVFDAKTGAYVNTVLLDDADLGAADPWDVKANERHIVVSHAGTSELSYIDRKAFEDRLAAAAGRDLSTDMTFLAGIRRRVKTVKRGPRNLAIGSDGVVRVAEYLEDKPGVSAGELAFNDATLCFQQWQSCASCHPGGRSDGFKWSFPGKDGGFSVPETTCDLTTRSFTGEKIRAMVRDDFGADLFSAPDESAAEAMSAYLLSIFVSSSQSGCEDGNSKMSMVNE